MTSKFIGREDCVYAFIVGTQMDKCMKIALREQEEYPKQEGPKKLNLMIDPFNLSCNLEQAEKNNRDQNGHKTYFKPLLDQR
jgi:hypothetical protein